MENGNLKPVFDESATSQYTDSLSATVRERLVPHAMYGAENTIELPKWSPELPLEELEYCQFTDEKGRPSYEPRDNAIVTLLAAYRDRPEVQRRVLGHQKYSDLPSPAKDASERLAYEANRYDLLNAGQEPPLFAKIERALWLYKELGDFIPETPEHEEVFVDAAYAHELLVFSNLRLIRAVSITEGFDCPLEERVQMAAPGLLQAVRRFDCTRGLKFSTFAMPCILDSLRSAITRDHLLYMPKTVVQQGRSALRSVRQLEQQKSWNAAVATLARERDMPAYLLERILHNLPYNATSLNQPVDETETEVLEVVAMQPDEADDLATIERRSVIDGLFRTSGLSTNEYMVLSLRHQVYAPALARLSLNGKTYDELFAAAAETISQDAFANQPTWDVLVATLGLGKVRIQSLEKRALAKLRSVVSEHPEDF